jgi:hypothetical protein
MVLHREQLDAGTCSTPGCDHASHDGLYLHGRCHPASPTWAEYRATGVVRITCGTCRKLICEIAVASQKEQAATEAAAAAGGN